MSWKLVSLLFAVLLVAGCQGKFDYERCGDAVEIVHAKLKEFNEVEVEQVIKVLDEEWEHDSNGTTEVLVLKSGNNRIYYQRFLKQLEANSYRTCCFPDAEASAVKCIMESLRFDTELRERREFKQDEIDHMVHQIRDDCQKQKEFSPQESEEICSISDFIGLIIWVTVAMLTFLACTLIVSWGNDFAQAFAMIMVLQVTEEVARRQTKPKLVRITIGDFVKEYDPEEETRAERQSLSDSSCSGSDCFEIIDNYEIVQN